MDVCAPAVRERAEVTGNDPLDRIVGDSARMDDDAAPSASCTAWRPFGAARCSSRGPVRHRQGACRTERSTRLSGRVAQGALRLAELRGDPREPPRERALRPRDVAPSPAPRPRQGGPASRSRMVAASSSTRSSEMSQARCRSRLLRVLQEGEFRRVGGKDTVHTDVRVVIAASQQATSRSMVRAKATFREDLFYRLRVLPVAAAGPCASASEDIPALAHRPLPPCGPGSEAAKPIMIMRPEAMDAPHLLRLARQRARARERDPACSWPSGRRPGDQTAIAISKNIRRGRRAPGDGRRDPDLRGPERV